MRNCLSGLLGIILAFLLIVVVFGFIGHLVGQLFRHALVVTIVMVLVGSGVAYLALNKFRKIMAG